MTQKATISFFLTLLLTHGEEKTDTSSPNPRQFIPAGAIISDISLPYFDDKQRTVSLLHAESLTLDSTNENLVHGKNLRIWLFNPDGSTRASTHLPDADYLVTQQQLHTSGQTLFTEPQNQFAVLGSGGIFSLKNQQALLLGPSKTIFNTSTASNTKTTMNLKPITALAAATSLANAEPPKITPEHLADFERSVAKKNIPEYDGNQNLKDLPASDQKTSDNLQQFLTEAGKPNLVKKSPQTKPNSPDLESLFKLQPGKILINNTDGIYFDGKSNEVVYLGNINLQGQGITLTCTDNLKAIFKQPKSKSSEKKHPH